MEMVNVSADALRQVLQALFGAPHLIRELMVRYQLSEKGLSDRDDPISVLVDQYNAAAEAETNQV